MDRNSKDGRLKGMICSLCVILIIFGCADKQNRYGINFNDQRSIIKLPLLDSSWKYSPSYTSEGGTWVNPQKRDGVPCYFQKRNLIKNNRIIWDDRWKYTRIFDCYILFRKEEMGIRLSYS